MQPTSIQEVMQLIGTLTLTGFLFISWRLEREERIKSQDEHKADLRKYANLAQIVMDEGRAAVRQYRYSDPEGPTKILPRADQQDSGSRMT